jgi:predicted TIM-barrel fold metal-dependent hydrolase
MDYRIISADSHIDMTWLPGELFVSQAPARWKDQVPKVVETPEGPRWVAEDKILGVVGGLGHGFTPPKRGVSHRTDRMLEAGFYANGAEGKPHPTTPELRLKDMALDGIDAEVIYGILATGVRLQNRDLVAVVYHIYNAWVAEFCASYPGRWAGLACIPNHDARVAAQEVEQAARLGLKGADFDVVTASSPLWDRSWDPLWAALQETGLPISFHVTGPRGYPLRAPSGDVWADTVHQGIRLTLFQMGAAEFVASIIFSGALERYPGLEFVLGEAGAGWLPYTLERMDLEYEDRLHHHLKLSMQPSDYWRRQGHTTFQTETTGPRMVEMIGEDTILWGSDYPHPDGVWPDSQETIQRDMGHLDERLRRKILCENAAALYGFEGC